MLACVFSFCGIVCCTTEFTLQPQQAGDSVTFIETANKRFLVLRLGLWPNLRVGPTSFEKVRHGMTEVDVEKMLGSPTKVDSIAETMMVLTPMGLREIGMVKHSVWVGLDQVIVVHFGKKRTVELSRLESLEEWATVDCQLDIRSALEKLRDWLLPVSQDCVMFYGSS